VDEYDEFSGYVEIGLGCGCGDTRPVSADCLAVCAPGAPALCDKDWCACQCHQDDDDPAARARELDDRDDAHLAAVARDLEAEARPDLDGLLRERYGRPTRGAA
jgi:hypothetical protein